MQHPFQHYDGQRVQDEALEFAGIGLYRYTFDGKVVFMDRGAWRILGLEDRFAGPEAVIGKNVAELVDPAWPTGVLRQEVRAHGQVRGFERPLRTLAGEERWVRQDSYVVHDSAGGEELVQVVIRDITDRKQMEFALKESEEKYRKLFEEAIDGIFVADPQTGILVDCNRAAAELVGRDKSELIGEHQRILHPPSEVIGGMSRTFVQHVREAEGQVLEAKVITRKGELRDVAIKAHTLELKGKKVIQGIFRDITAQKQAEEDRRKLEAQFQHAQKLESLGVLAGGIAHDFNNLLMGILGHADMALMDLAPESPARDSVQQIELSARRAAELVRQMLAYSGKGKFVVEPVDLTRLVEEMAHLIEVSITKKAVLRYHFERHLPAIEADPTQIRQVVMNLITNASDAIEDTSGVISICTGAMDCNREYFKETYVHEELPEGLYVFLEVADTGRGMDEETKERMFDPFFTTKFTGRGLGLSAVLGIVRGHRGAIKVYTEPGRGTTFRVLFPAAGELAKPPAPVADTKRRKDGGTILVVDDEETVRAITAKMLQRFGFTVLTAPDGHEGVEMFRRHAGDICLVILDMTMPHMDGEEALSAIRRIKGDARVILSSGYTEQEAGVRFAGKGLSGFLQKPYAMQTLLDVVGQALES